MSESSKKTYHEKLVLLKFLLENKPECLADDHGEELETHHATDKSNAMTGKRPKHIHSYLLVALHIILNVLSMEIITIHPSKLMENEQLLMKQCKISCLQKQTKSK